MHKRVNLLARWFDSGKRQFTCMRDMYTNMENYQSRHKPTPKSENPNVFNETYVCGCVSTIDMNISPYKSTRVKYCEKHKNIKECPVCKTTEIECHVFETCPATLAYYCKNKHKLGV